MSLQLLAIGHCFSNFAMPEQEEKIESCVCDNDDSINRMEVLVFCRISIHPSAELLLSHLFASWKKEPNWIPWSTAFIDKAVDIAWNWEKILNKCFDCLGIFSTLFWRFNWKTAYLAFMQSNRDMPSKRPVTSRNEETELLWFDPFLNRTIWTKKFALLCWLQWLANKDTQSFSHRWHTIRGAT